MNPLSTRTFYRRHRRRAALLLGLIGLTTAALYLMVALQWAIFVEPMRTNSMFLSKFSVVGQALFGGESDATVPAQIRANPDVARVIPAFQIQMRLPEVMGSGSSSFFLLGLAEEDLPYVMERCGATLKEGRLLEPRTNGVMLSKEIAANLDLVVGDMIHNAINPDLYFNIVAPMEVVGIVESDVRLGIVSYEYLDSHQLYGDWPPSFLVVAREGREAAVDGFLRSEIGSRRVWVSTFLGLADMVAREYQATYSVLIPIIAAVAIALTLVMGVVNRIAITRRLPEFGILHAAGHSRRWLTRRLTLETGLLALIGWALGIGLSWLILYLLKLAMFAPRGYDLDAVAPAPVVLVTPVPMAVIGFTLISVSRTFSRLDPVAIVERGELSLEETPRRAATKSSPQPLASRTFFRRHRQRALLITGAMALMIMAVVLVVFPLSATRDVQKASLGYLSRMSRIYPRPGSRLHPGIVTQVQTHPAVERVIPVAPRWGMLSMLIPPFGENENASPFGVYAEDMAYLVELYGLQLKEGHLPRPHTNEMVIPEALAQNRNLEIGDVIGDPNHPVYPGAPSLPSAFVISGIFARPTGPDGVNWLGFVSLEFMESHEGFRIQDDSISSLMVVPKPGQKAALDDWLEHELASDDVSVLTYRQEAAGIREKTRSTLLTIALLEGAIALVAAVALAVLNYISVSERQAEFGLLHALGYGRVPIVWRTVRETAFTASAAWGLSALLCLAGLLVLQFRVFTPLGLRLDLFNLTPWLFTLPIPVAVLAATTGTVARLLSRLDPVSIIERR